MMHGHIHLIEYDAWSHSSVNGGPIFFLSVWFSPIKYVLYVHRLSQDCVLIKIIGNKSIRIKCLN